MIMPLTVITVKRVSSSLKGELSKWMQEIATGVYVGNFNTKVREKLWERVKENASKGEATMSFSCRNEIGYQFETFNTQREVINVDGIPLVLLRANNIDMQEDRSIGFSDASKFHKARNYSSIGFKDLPKMSYVVIDLETDGLNENENNIIEMGAIRFINDDKQEFQCFIKYDKILPGHISELTGITNKVLEEEGISLDKGLEQFIEFIGDDALVGYNIQFDIRFINRALKTLGKEGLKNKSFDLLRYIKKEKMFLEDYKLETVLTSYGIDNRLPHRALLDAIIIHNLSTKVNKFLVALEKN